MNGLNNTGTLYLTSHRLAWFAHRFRPPLTSWLGAKKIVLPLQFVECRMQGISLVVQYDGNEYVFRLFKWWLPSFTWWKLTRRWADAIGAAKESVQERV